MFPDCLRRSPAHEAQTIAPIACVQNPYNIAHRDDDALIDTLIPPPGELTRLSGAAA